MDGLFRRFDVVLICNSANAPFALVPRLGGSHVALNVDGLEWQRAKWSPLGRGYYQMCAWLAPKLPIVLVSDAKVIAEWYQDRHGKATVYIPYGSSGAIAPPGPTLAWLGLTVGRYILFVSRLEPENNAHLVIAAYLAAGGSSGLGVPLVIVGDAPYASDYKRSLESAASADPGILLTGYIFGDGYVELQSNALLYVQATEVGGTHPALVEAMSRGVCIIANDVPEHREVLGDAGRYYRRNDPGDLAAAFVDLVSLPDRCAVLGATAAARARAEFSWESVADRYEALFERMTAPRPARGRAAG
jgi:glycosyltransferase involved in cell wall biosynthesis